MTEDEAFEDLEHRLNAQKSTEYIQRAQIEAARFIHDHQNELGMMTLRKVFELGFRHGYTHGTDTRTK
jgi:hypothetical protein